MKIKAWLTTLVLLGATTTAHSQELPPGYGTPAPSGSKLTTTLANGIDVDDYVFVGYPGQKAQVTLKVSKKSSTNASLVLLRPDGTEVSADALSAKFKTGRTITVITQVQNPDTGEIEDVPVEVPQVTKIKFTLDQVGTWKARVRIPDGILATGETGTYTIATKVGPLPKTSAKNPERAAEKLFLLPLHAEGGALVNFAFAYKGGSVTFEGLRAPDGAFVDPGTRLKTKSGKSLKATKVAVPEGFPRGRYVLELSVADAAPLTKSKFSASVKLPKGATKQKGKLDANEPAVAGDVGPDVGGPPSRENPGTQITVTVLNAFDEHDPDGTPELLLGDTPLTDVSTTPTQGATFVQGRVPSSIRDGVHDVVVRTSTGQTTVRERAFTVVPPPVALTIDPTVGPDTGGFPITITGEGLPDDPSHIGLVIDDSNPPWPVLELTANSVTFEAKSWTPGKVTIGIRDLRSQLVGKLPLESFEFVTTPAISRVIPGLVTILGGDDVFVKGTDFRDTDRVFLETASGSFEEMNSTFLSDTLHKFTAPIRPKGTYEVYVEYDGSTRTPGRRTISYFQFADFTSASGTGDGNDAYASTLADFDDDGDEDLFLARRGSGGRGTASLLQVFVNDGSGVLTDESATRIPAPSATDDWRADSICLADVTRDGYPDIVITTNSTSVPAGNQSHTRILESVRRGPSSAADDRVFVDHTLDLMAPPRPGVSGVSNSDGDNWRGLDMWVGDVDRGPAGPPEILIAHNDKKEEIDVLCGNYCSSQIGGALYRFYWGGSRAFVWDPSKRAGRGQYRFEHNFFPRKSGVLVPIAGTQIPACNTNTPCRGEFTPFTGHSLSVSDLDGDGRPDVVVLSDEPVTAFGAATSSLQVGLNVVDTTTGSLITDVTADVHALGGITTGDAVSIGLFGYPDGHSYGTIIVAQSSAPAGGDRALRMIDFVPTTVPDDLGDFADVTDGMLPGAAGGEAWQATAIATVDVDADGDQDLVLVANAAPGPGLPATRILRNVAENLQTGLLRNELAPLIRSVTDAAGDPFDGTALSIGDLDGDGAAEFVITRSVPVGTGPQTRTITTDQ